MMANWFYYNEKMDDNTTSDTFIPDRQSDFIGIINKFCTGKTIMTMIKLRLFIMFALLFMGSISFAEDTSFGITYEKLSDFAKGKPYMEEYVKHLSKQKVPVAKCFIMVKCSTGSPGFFTGIEDFGAVSYDKDTPEPHWIERGTLFTLVDGKTYNSSDALHKYLTGKRKSDTVVFTVWSKKIGDDSYETSKKSVLMDEAAKTLQIKTDATYEQFRLLSTGISYPWTAKTMLDALRNHAVKSDDGRLAVAFANTTIPFGRGEDKGGVLYTMPFIIQFDGENGKDGYYTCDGKAVKAVITSDNEEVGVIDADGFIIKKPGTFNLIVSIADSKVSQKITVVAEQLGSGDSVEKIIQTYGVPKTSEIKLVTNSWPKASEVDGFKHSDLKPGNEEHWEHWHYKAHPNTIFIIWQKGKVLKYVRGAMDPKYLTQ